MAAPRVLNSGLQSRPGQVYSGSSSFHPRVGKGFCQRGEGQGQGFVIIILTDLGVDVVVEAVEGFKAHAAEAADVGLSIPGALGGEQPDGLGSRPVAENGAARDQAVGVPGTNPAVQLVLIHVGRAGAKAVLVVVCNCRGIGVGEVAQGALHGAAVVDV